MKDKLINFAENVKKKRLEQNKTLRKLAEESGITAATISAYEKQIKFPSLENAIAICEALGCTLDEMCKIKGEKKIENIKTYAELFEHLLVVFDNVPIFMDGNNVAFGDNIVIGFINEWFKLKHYVLDNAFESEIGDKIKKELYEAWKEKQLKIFNKIQY